jgi:hypothetical protein
MNRRNCLKIFAAGVPLYLARSAFAQDDTLSGYLMSTGRDPSFAARKVMWADYRPAEKYTGSAEQNIAFLKAIKAFDAAPQIELVKGVFGQNEEVKVKIKAKNAAAALGIETGLGLQSINVAADEVVSLGKASAAGSYSIRLSDSVVDRRYQLFLLPTNGGFGAELYGATAKALPPSSPAFYQPEANIAAALTKLYDSITKEAIEDALQAIPPWMAENAAALGETLVVCAVGGPVPCLVSGAANGWSAMSAVLTKLATTSPALNNQEKELLKTVFAVGDAAGQVAASFFGIPQRKRLCELSELGIVIADSIAGEINERETRITLKIVLQSTKKYTSLLCATKI